MKKIANWLISLGKKAIAVLPGILGTILSKILTAASSVVGFLAEHLIITLAVIILVIIQILIKNADTIKHRANKFVNK